MYDIKYILQQTGLGSFYTDRVNDKEAISTRIFSGSRYDSIRLICYV